MAYPALVWSMARNVSLALVHLPCIDPQDKTLRTGPLNENAQNMDMEVDFT